MSDSGARTRLQGGELALVAHALGARRPVHGRPRLPARHGDVTAVPIRHQHRSSRSGLSCRLIPELRMPATRTSTFFARRVGGCSGGRSYRPDLGPQRRSVVIEAHAKERSWRSDATSQPGPAVERPPPQARAPRLARVVLAAMMIGGAAAPTTDARGPRIRRAAGVPTRSSRRVHRPRRRAGPRAQPRTATVDHAAFQAALDDVERGSPASPSWGMSVSRAHGASLVSADRRSTLVQFEIIGDSTTGRGRMKPVLAAIARSRAANPEFTIRSSETPARAGRSRRRRGRRAPGRVLVAALTLLILVAAFGTLVAAGLPLLFG